MKDMIQLDVQLTSYPYRIWATSSKILLSHHLFLSFYSLCPSKPQNKWWNSSFPERQRNLEIREQSQTNTLQSRYDQNQGYMEKTWEIWKWSAYNQMDWEEVWYSEKDQNLPKLLQSKCCNQERNVNKGWGEDLEEIKCYQKKRENLKTKRKPQKWMGWQEAQGNAPKLAQIILIEIAVRLTRKSPYSVLPFFLFLQILYTENDVVWSGISLWLSWSSLKCEATFRCKYAWRKLYSAFMHFTSKPFSTQQTTPIFTNLLDIQKHTCFPTYNLFIHSIIWYFVVVPKSIFLWLHENFLPHWFPIVLQCHFSSRWISQ